MIEVLRWRVRILRKVQTVVSFFQSKLFPFMTTTLIIPPGVKFRVKPKCHKRKSSYLRAGAMRETETKVYTQV